MPLNRKRILDNRHNRLMTIIVVDNFFCIYKYTVRSRVSHIVSGIRAAIKKPNKTKTIKEREKNNELLKLNPHLRILTTKF